jgi:acyl-ACP thioesterase
MNNGPEGRFITHSRNIIVHATLKETVSSVRWCLAHSIIYMYMKMILDQKFFYLIQIRRDKLHVNASWRITRIRLDFLAYSQNTQKYQRIIFRKFLKSWLTLDHHENF